MPGDMFMCLFIAKGQFINHIKILKLSLIGQQVYWWKEKLKSVLTFASNENDMFYTLDGWEGLQFFHIQSVASVPTMKMCIMTYEVILFDDI